MTSTYCNQRWCNICNSIRTSKLIEWYSPQLGELVEPYFITLSRPNVKGEDLKTEVAHYVSSIQKICKSINKYFDKVHGIRKLECTFNLVANTFHPHFHMVVSGQAVAEKILSCWITENPTAMMDKGNQCAPCYDTVDKEGNVVPWSHELFKYFTKLTVKTGMNHKVKDKKTGKDIWVPLQTNCPSWAMDVMLQAVSKRRVFQSHGKLIKTIDENIKVDEAIQVQRVDIETGELIEGDQEWFYDPVRLDWVNPCSSEILTGYKPKLINVLLELHNLQYYAKQYKCVAKMLKDLDISCLRTEKRYLKIDSKGSAKLLKEKARKRRFVDADKQL